MSAALLHIDLDELALRGGESFERAFPLDLAPIILGGVSYQVLVPGGVAVRVNRIAGGYLLTVSLSASLYGPCARCLAEATLKVDAEQQEFVPTSKEDRDENEMSPFIEDFVADVAGMAREATVLALPGQVLCRDNCRGLCPECGKDLNKDSCDCAEKSTDNRWSALRNLKLDD